MKKISFPLLIFYDGSCSVCAKEIQHYNNKDRHDRLVLIDISEKSFDPAMYGRTREEFMAVMHVRDGDGYFFTGVDAFPVIWRALPGKFFHILAFTLMLPGVHFLAEMGYALFARYRKVFFPPEKGCKNGQCGLGHFK